MGWHSQYEVRLSTTWTRQQDALHIANGGRLDLLAHRPLTSLSLLLTASAGRQIVFQTPPFGDLVFELSEIVY